MSATEARRLKRVNERLTQTTCFACREKGHAARDCPKAVKSFHGEDGQVKTAAVVGICYRYICVITVLTCQHTNLFLFHSVVVRKNTVFQDVESPTTRPILIRLRLVSYAMGKVISHLHVHKIKKKASTPTVAVVSFVAKPPTLQGTARCVRKVGVWCWYFWPYFMRSLLISSKRPHDYYWYSPRSRCGWRWLPRFQKDNSRARPYGEAGRTNEKNDRHKKGRTVRDCGEIGKHPFTWY